MPILRKTRKPTATSSDLVASAIIDLNDEVGRAYLRSTRNRVVRESQRAWKWYETIPEVHYGVARSARIAGYSRFRPHIINADGTPGEAITNPTVQQITASLYSPYGGVRQLASRFYTLMKVPGEAHLIRCRDEDGNPDGYDFLSADELDVAELEFGEVLHRLTTPVTGGVEVEATRIPIRNEDYIGRVWIPSARYVDYVDSPLGAADILCEQLDLLTKSTVARLKSRIAQAGILLIPSEIQVIDDRNPDDMVYDRDALVDKLMKTWVKAIRSQQDPSAVVPHILRGQADALDKVRFIFADREIMQIDMELRSELINRIMMGLDSQQDAVKGVGESNHWSAWAASDEERRIAIMPDIEMLAWTITRMVFQPALADANVDNWEQIGLFADISSAAARSNQAEDGRQLFDRGALSEDALRRTNNINEADAPTDDEFVRWVGRQTKNPYLMLFGLPVADEVDWDEAARWTGKTGPAPDSTADESPIGPGVGEPGSPDDNETDTPRSQRPA